MALKIHIVYIGASWCTTCKTIGPATEALCAKFGVELKKLDYDRDLEEDEKDADDHADDLNVTVGPQLPIQ